MDEDNQCERIKLSDGKKFKRIKLSDGGIVMTSDERLARMYEGLPALKFILEGHPLMKQQQQEDGNDEEKHYDFSMSEDYGIQQNEWILMVDFFSPDSIPPTSIDRWVRLKHVTTVLGSSDAVDKAYKSVLTNRVVLPVDDDQDLFSWITVRTSEIRAREDWNILDRKIEDGFKVVYEEPYVDNRGVTYFLQHYRKRNVYT